MSSHPYDQFIQDRRYLKNVSPRTIEWYETAFKWLRRYCPDEPTQEGLRAFVIGMREAGLKPITCNGNIRVVKAYLNWKEQPLKLDYLKTEQRQVQIFKPEDISKLLRFKPRGKNDKRVHLLTPFLLDTGCRLEEILGTKWPDVDLDNMLLTVHGKGNKDRKVPISFELRKHLWVNSGSHPVSWTPQWPWVGSGRRG